MKQLFSMFFLTICAIGCSDQTSSNLSIWEAAEKGYIQKVQEQLAEGVDINAKGERTWMEATPLHHAAKGGHLDIVELLIKNGADVNSIGRKNPFGTEKTALDIAIEYDLGNSDVAEYLRNHGGKQSKELVSD